MEKYTTQNFKDFQNKVLSEAERTALGNDSIFWKEYQEYLSWRIAGKNLIREAKQEKTEEATKPFFIFYKKPLSLAAAVLFFTVGLWWINTDSNEKSQSGQIMGVDSTQTVMPQDSTKIDTLLMQK